MGWVVANTTVVTAVAGEASVAVADTVARVHGVVVVARVGRRSVDMAIAVGHEATVGNLVIFVVIVMTVALVISVTKVDGVALLSGIVVAVAVALEVRLVAVGEVAAEAVSVAVAVAVTVTVAVDGVAFLLGLVAVVVDDGVGGGTVLPGAGTVVILSIVVVDVSDGVDWVMSLVSEVDRVLSLIMVLVVTVERVGAVDTVVAVGIVVGHTVDSSVNKIFGHLVFSLLL